MPDLARNGAFVISADPARLDLDVIHAYLVRSYWAAGIPREVVERSIRHSMCFGVYEHAEGDRARLGAPGAGRQVGFARVISDRATYAYLGDVFILEAYRGRGLSKWLVRTILDHPDLQGLRRFALLTRDAQTLYGRFGFANLDDPTRYMEIRNPDVYRRSPA